MALTKDIISAVPVLAGLTEEQITAIVFASTADENATIGAKIGELHGKYEKDIFDVSGISKNDGEKAYDYNKRVLADYKQKATALTSEVEELRKGGDKKELEKTLAKQVQDIAVLTTKLSEAQKDYDKKLKDYKLEFQFKAAASDIVLKEAFQGDIAKILFEQSKNEILGKYDTDFIGGELVFKDKTTNDIVRNPEDSYKPITIKDLYKDTIIATAIETKAPKAGAGSKNPKSDSVIGLESLNGAKTQVEADLLIHDELVKKGFTRGSQEYAAEQLKIRTENKVSELPLR